MDWNYLAGRRNLTLKKFFDGLGIKTMFDALKKFKEKGIENYSMAEISSIFSPEVLPEVLPEDKTEVLPEDKTEVLPEDKTDSEFLDALEKKQKRIKHDKRKSDK